MHCSSILEEIVRNNRLDLIERPVVAKLIDIKWAQFGKFRHTFDVSGRGREIMIDILRLTLYVAVCPVYVLPGCVELRLIVSPRKRARRLPWPASPHWLSRVRASLDMSHWAISV